MSIENIASQSNVVSKHDLKDPISGVHVSQGSADTLVRRGGISDYHSIAYSVLTQQHLCQKLPKSVDVR